MAKVVTKTVNVKTIRRRRAVAKYRERVLKFFSRDDNSRNIPGKADCVKSTSGEKTQKRVLTDYLSTLYQKFISENPGLKLSFTSFSRIRPRYILLSSLITRDTCLCTKHQNMSLTLKAARKHNVNTPLNGEKMLEQKHELLEDIEKQITLDKVVVGQWKRIQVEVKRQMKSKMKIVDSEMTKTEFVQHVTTQIEDFDEHVLRIKTQFFEMKRLKDNLPSNHTIVHMDLSENYSCKSVQEIQSAYWNQTGVTLHPVVVYYKPTEQQEMLHKSFVYISDEMGHNSATVLTFIDHLIPEIKTLDPETEVIHFWTDSPTSQYRNKFIVHAIANHKAAHGINCTWNYWKAGYGKGPCDGLGGTVKRMADNAVKSGKVAIQEPIYFYAWSQSDHCTMKNVVFKFVESEECQKKATEIAKLKLKPISETMKIHAVKGKGECEIAVRNTSCYCTLCLSEPTTTCETWRFKNIGQPQVIAQAISQLTEVAMPSTPLVSNHVRKENINQNDFVAATYLDKWYIGKVINVDDEDNTFEISFLTQRKEKCQWPTNPDIIWVERDDVLCTISSPKPFGKSQRMLTVKQEDIKRVEEVFFRKIRQ